jgi:quercetin dioxygenase-like cupin family protein
MKTITLAAAVLAGAFAYSTHASAGVCPADQTHIDARTSGETMPSKVTDNELAFVALGGEINGLDNRRLRLRRLVVQPGGVVPWHSHTDRPALIMTVSGQITEFNSTCAVGIVHKAGDVAQEKKGVSHWWKNTGKVPAVLIAADIKNDADATPAADHM